MIREISLTVRPETACDEKKLKGEISSKVGVNQSEINDFKIIKKSVDARRLPVKINLRIKVAVGSDKSVLESPAKILYSPLPADAPQIVIVGAGPAGLFAALKAIELGIRPIILERGKDVDKRRRDLAEISREDKLNPDSNFCFGEGGAGAFSDGKLFTRSKKRGNVSEVLETLCRFGASEDILINSHPHIGSDKLPGIIKNIRQQIIESGGEVKFETKVVGLLIENGEDVGVTTSSGENFLGPVFLATGHSARDVYRMLNNEKVTLEAKGLAIGVRLEHPQNLIDQLQYHSKEGRGQYLPPAEYRFVTQVDGRGVYSFCMCPGGVIVPSMSGPEQSVVNGMSASARSGKFANSGMVVELHPGDIKGFENQGVLEMLALQENLEKKFYEAADGTHKAPAQRMTDFIKKKDTFSLPKSSYAPGLIPGRLDKLLPAEIETRLRKGFLDFDKKCRGFVNTEGVMIGLESRTSSPVRIPRDADTLEHIEVKKLYPLGEGAGYAGGIVSAAIDGQRSVEAYNKNYLSNNDLNING